METKCLTIWGKGQALAKYSAGSVMEAHELVTAWLKTNGLDGRAIIGEASTDTDIHISEAAVDYMKELKAVTRWCVQLRVLHTNGAMSERKARHFSDRDECESHCNLLTKLYPSHVITEIRAFENGMQHIVLELRDKRLFK